MDSNSRSLTVESDIEDVVRLDKVDVFIKELEALFVIDYADVRLLLDAKALTSHFLDLPHCRSLFLVKVYKHFLIRLVHASVNTDRYLYTFKHIYVSALSCINIWSSLNTTFLSPKFFTRPFPLLSPHC